METYKDYRGEISKPNSVYVLKGVFCPNENFIVTDRKGNPCKSFNSPHDLPSPFDFRKYEYQGSITDKIREQGRKISKLSQVIDDCLLCLVDQAGK